MDSQMTIGRVRQNKNMMHLKEEIVKKNLNKKTRPSARLLF